MVESKVTREANPYFGLLRMERTEVVSGVKARFVFEPLPRGFGMTLGNSLRRVLLAWKTRQSFFSTCARLR
jgi:hypothetical protein